MKPQDKITARVAELRGFAYFGLAFAFGALMVGAMILALRDPGETTAFISGLVAVACSGVLGVCSLYLWLAARRLDERTSITRGNRRSL